MFIVACFDQYPFSLAAALMGINEIMLKLARSLRKGRRLAIMCWRGGERSRNVALLLALVGVHAVTVKGKPVELTATEFKLLDTLLERRGRVQSRAQLLQAALLNYPPAHTTLTLVLSLAPSPLLFRVPMPVQPMLSLNQLEPGR